MSVPSQARADVRTLAPFVLILLIASAVRFLGIGNTDLWGDEAFSVMSAVGPIRSLLSSLATGEPHPPVYPLLLASWLRLFGRAEAIARLPSAFFGIGSVAVAAAIGRGFAAPNDREGSHRAAMIAGLLVAISPIQIWYSQEARMYEQLSFFAGLATLLLLRLKPGKPISIVGYSIALVATAGSHYYGLFVPVAHGIALLSLRGPAGQVRRAWFSGVALAGALYFPWVYVAREIFLGYSAARPGTVDLAAVALSAWVRLAAGWSLSWPIAVATAIVSTVFVIAGLRVRALSETERILRRVLLFWLVIPFVFGFVVSLIRPLYAERYLVVSSLPMLLLAARAVSRSFTARGGPHPASGGLSSPAPWSRVGKATGYVALAISAGMTVYPLANLWSGRYIKSTYNTHVRDTEGLIRPHDAVILDGTSQRPLYNYYVNSSWPMYPLPRDVPLDVEQTIRELQNIAARHSGVWIFLYATADYDPNYLVARWLTQHAYRAFDDWAVTGRLQYYRFDEPQNLSSSSSSIDFGTSVHLSRVRSDLRNVGAGDSVPVSLEWQRPAVKGPRLRVSLRLVDQAGFTWAQTDQDIGGDYFDEGDWPAGAQLDDHHAILIPPGTPPGSYRLHLSAYQATDGRPINASGSGLPLEADGVTLGTVTVTSASDHFWAEGIGGYRRLALRFDPGLELMGYAQSNTVAAGDSGYLTLVWKATEGGPRFTTLQVDLLDARGKLAQTNTVPIATASFPVASWQIGDVNREQYHLAIRAGLPAGSYRLIIRPVTTGASARAGPTAILGHIDVTPGSTLAVATPSVQLHYSLGDSIAFDGYDVDPPVVRPGGRIRVTLHWRDLASVTTDYTVFVHVLDSAQKVVAQRDAIPGAGTRPTSAWFPDDVIVDPYDVEIPTSLAPGSYDVEVGLYNPVDGTRLAVSKDGVASGSQIVVGQIEVAP